ncbi:hypothetical protein E2C01_025285 [Portunus trituberculatus]|uniref:Uncharacterized protein n=1 Tax=Portunus trituberculatus TaxID=210409 RepID=A0A5B7EHH5_PORTR|nr:hypothetical protein [Portunus trituberculatus]
MTNRLLLPAPPHRVGTTGGDYRQGKRLAIAYVIHATNLFFLQRNFTSLNLLAALWYSNVQERFHCLFPQKTVRQVGA